MRIQLCTASSRKGSFTGLLLGIAAFVCVGFCDSSSEQKTARQRRDVVLWSFQVELLEIAFGAASAMPINPHVKSRSLMQEAVVAACLELQQPQRALRYIEQIDNWRRGTGYADLALYYAQHGAMKEEVEPYLLRAAEVAEQTEDWRRDRINAKRARTYSRMGQNWQTQASAANMEDSTAMSRPVDSFQEEMEALEKRVSSKSFDAVKGALEDYIELYSRFYGDAKRKALIEEKIRASWGGMPILVRIDLLKALARSALAHEDQNGALELVNEARTMMDSASLEPRFGVPMRAGLAELLFSAGDQERARTEVADGLETFEANRQKIVNIDRARILRSIAEACQAMGDISAARNLYKRALEAGMENPNSRPRAEDLTTTCCSMALHGVDPGAELLSRIREIRDGLGDPW